MARIPRQHFSKTFQQDKCSRFSKQQADFWHGFLGREAVQQGRTAILGMEIEAARGCTIQKSFAVVLARKSRFWTAALIVVCTDFEEAVQLHLLQISGHANRGERTSFIAILFLLFVHFPRRWLSTENEISCKSLFADYFFC